MPYTVKSLRFLKTIYWYHIWVDKLFFFKLFTVWLTQEAYFVINWSSIWLVSLTVYQFVLFIYPEQFVIAAFKKTRILDLQMTM